MGLRVGYVNIHGLTAAKWERAGELLNTSVDLLFLAETWFVDHERYARHRRFITATPNQTAEVYRRGRNKGGIYLLSTAKARGQIQQIQSTEHSITIKLTTLVISAVYWPPSMPPAELKQQMKHVQASTVILGDLNTRFADAVHQSGQPGPPERVQAMARYWQRTGLEHLKPLVDALPSCWSQRVKQETQLTVDHVFVRKHVHHPRLQLISNASLGWATDHRYLLWLQIGTSQRPASLTTTPRLLRYRTSRVRMPEIQRQLQAAMTPQLQQQPRWPSNVTVDAMNDSLVRIAQAVCQDVLGQVPATTTQTPMHQAAADSLREEQSALASIQLYKRAAAMSRENGVIVPTTTAQQRGETALQENVHTFATRYQGRGWRGPPRAADQSLPPITLEEVQMELNEQAAARAAGTDGLHIQVLQAWTQTKFPAHLQQLFQRCFETGHTPRAWNRSEICLLIKDPQKPRNADNLRPITLIVIFRKIFEKLLLTRFDTAGWARLHPAQAGFRSQYSTYSNAAIVHHLLRSHTRSTAVFLDFRAAFDTVDHPLLMETLQQRQCPPQMQSLIASLMCQHVQSRVLVNGEVSAWFDRTQGVMQGSPLSPYLFNLFIDDLVTQLNQNATKDPYCLFYADDGVLVTPQQVNVQAMLDQVDRWAQSHRLMLNVRKCGHITRIVNPPTVYLGGQAIPHVQEYQYLGFPMIANGIDFAKHLQTRLAAALHRARFLTLEATTWGIAHRLRVAKQYLMPMYEYGAPLVQVWRQESAEHQTRFDQATGQYRDLIAWITNTQTTRHHISVNLLGLTSIHARFQHLRTAYQAILMQQSDTNPLSRLLHRTGPPSRLNHFLYGLRDDAEWQRFVKTKQTDSAIKAALTRYLQGIRSNTIASDASKAHLTSVIPFTTRQRTNLKDADSCLTSKPTWQEIFFQYRRGLFMFDYDCKCGTVQFHRGHETCPALIRPVRLSPDEEIQKAQMQQGLRNGGTLTAIDWLLNTGQWSHAIGWLLSVKHELNEVYHVKQACNQSQS